MAGEVRKLIIRWADGDQAVRVKVDAAKGSALREALRVRSRVRAGGGVDLAGVMRLLGFVEGAVTKGQFVRGVLDQAVAELDAKLQGGWRGYADMRDCLYTVFLRLVVAQAVLGACVDESLAAGDVGKGRVRVAMAGVRVSDEGPVVVRN